MTARQKATEDIKNDLQLSGKCFLAFREDLDPVMDRLVRQQLKQQISISPFHTPSRRNSQLIARCFFADGKIHYENYNKYYSKQ